MNQQRLLKSIDYYRQAVALSPQNAGLWNELATVQYIQDDLAGAADTLDRSLQVDDRFYPTYLLLGDVRTAQATRPARWLPIKRAREISPKNVSVLSAVGVAGAEAGEPAGVGRRLAAHHRPREPGAQLADSLAAKPGSNGCGRL